MAQHKKCWYCISFPLWLVPTMNKKISVEWEKTAASATGQVFLFPDFSLSFPFSEKWRCVLLFLLMNVWWEIQNDINLMSTGSLVWHIKLVLWKIIASDNVDSSFYVLKLPSPYTKACRFNESLSWKVAFKVSRFFIPSQSILFILWTSKKVIEVYWKIVNHENIRKYTSRAEQ